MASLEPKPVPRPRPASPPSLLPLQSVPTELDGIVAALRAAGCVFAEEEARLLLSEASSPAELAGNIQRRVEGVPLEHILGWVSFAGLRVLVTPGVFVPRRRTELLVNEALTLLSDFSDYFPGRARPTVVDLCCGSGAVGMALLQHGPRMNLHAVDIDPAAVRCTRNNLAPLGGRVHAGDLYAALPPSLHGRIRLLTVNAPYVPTRAIRTMPPEARLHEPAVSLDGGADGLDFHRRIAAEGIQWLAAGGYLLIETSERQAAGTSRIMVAAGFAVRVVRSEELGGTVVVGRLGSHSVPRGTVV